MGLQIGRVSSAGQTNAWIRTISAILVNDQILNFGLAAGGVDPNTTLNFVLVKFPPLCSVVSLWYRLAAAPCSSGSNWVNKNLHEYVEMCLHVIVTTYVDQYLIHY